MAAQERHAKLCDLVPALGVRLLLARKQATEPVVLALPGACLLFIDISGFTALSERFCAEAEVGHDGAHEALEALLRMYFSQLNRAIKAHGGEVCKYAGDALLCVFENHSSGGVSGAAEPSPVARAIAAGCAAAAMDFDCSAVEVGDALLALGFPPHFVAGLRLRCKSVVCGPGTLWVALIGGGSGVSRRELLLVGEPLEQLHRLSEHMRVGTCILPVSEAHVIPRDGLLAEIPGGYLLVEGQCAVGVPALLTSLTPLIQECLHDATLPSSVELASLCLEPVGNRLKAGLSPEVAGLCTCTVIFASLRLRDSDASPHANKEYSQLVHRFDAACRLFQQSLLRYGGALRQAIQDDKGCVLIGVFGIPTMAQAQSAYAACCAAAEFQAAEKSVAGVGVCTGRVFVGRVGDPHRAEISVLGDTVNTAARLMAHASARCMPAPLATESTRAAASTHLRTSTTVAFKQETEPIKAKGKSKLLTVFQILRVSDSNAVSSKQAGALGTTFVGRDIDVDALMGAAGAAAEGVRAPVERVVAVFGESGMGKSHLVHVAASRCEATFGARTLFCGASLDTRDQPFFIAGALLAQAIDQGDAAELHMGRWAGHAIPSQVLPPNTRVWFTPPANDFAEAEDLTATNRTQKDGCSTCSETPDDPLVPSERDIVSLFAALPGVLLSLRRALHLVLHVDDKYDDAMPLLARIEEVWSTIETSSSLLSCGTLAAIELRRFVTALLALSARRGSIGPRPASGVSYPLVLVIDDALWVDVPSIEVLVSLLDDDLPVALWLTSRPVHNNAYTSDSYGRLLKLARLRLLEGLGRKSSKHLIMSLFPDASDVDDALVDNLLQRTGGSPLFLRQICELLLQRGVLCTATVDSDDNGSRLTTVIAPRIDAEDIAAIPGSVEDVILERVDALGPRFADIVQAASLERQEGFIVAEAVQLACGTSASLGSTSEEETAIGNCSLFVRRSVGPPAVWGFAHSLMQNAVYNSISVERRRTWHMSRATALSAASCDPSTSSAVVHIVRSAMALHSASMERIAGHLLGAGEGAAAAALFVRSAELKPAYVAEVASLMRRAAALDTGAPLTTRLKTRALLAEALFLGGGHVDEMTRVVQDTMPLVCASLGLEITPLQSGPWPMPPADTLLAPPLRLVREDIARRPLRSLADAQAFAPAVGTEVHSVCESRCTVLMCLGRLVYGRNSSGAPESGDVDGTLLWSCYEALRGGQMHRFGIVGSVYISKLLEASMKAAQNQGAPIERAGFSALDPDPALERFLPSREFCTLARGILTAAAAAPPAVHATGESDLSFRIVALRWHFSMATLLPDALPPMPAGEYFDYCEAVASELYRLLQHMGSVDGADDARTLLLLLQISWGQYERAKSNIEVLLNHARDDSRGLRLAIALRNRVLLEAMRGSEAVAQARAEYVACQRNDRFPLNGALVRAVAAAADWLVPEAGARLYEAFGGDESSGHRSALLATMRASEDILRQVSSFSIQRITQSFYIFLHLDILGRFWRRVTPFLAAAPPGLADAVALGAAFTAAFRDALDAFIRVVDPLGPGLAICLYWSAWVPLSGRLDCLSGLTAVDQDTAVTSKCVNSSWAHEQSLQLLRRALAVAERRHELPLVARISRDLSALESPRAGYDNSTQVLSSVS